LYRISGKRGLILGDLHFDDQFQGRHVSYWENVIETIQRIQKVMDDEKPDFVILAGDLIGVRRGVSTIKDRNALLFVAEFLRSLPNPIVIKGNHDYNEVSDYDFLSKLGVFKSTKQIGGVVEFSHPSASKPCYIHCVDYGQENEKIEIVSSAYNIGVMHNEFYVAGKEQQVHSQGAIELTSKANFFGLDMILSGHIHMPTRGMIDFSFQNNFDSAFVNLGCPTRPSHGELYDQVWYIVIEYEPIDGTETWDLGFRQEPLMLRPYTEVFRPDSDYLDELTDPERVDEFTGIQRGKLEEILGNMVTTNMGSDDFFRQIDVINLVSDEVKDLAKSYLRKAMNHQ
jgi:predicted phosphodiesterase